MYKRQDKVKKYKDRKYKCFSPVAERKLDTFHNVVLNCTIAEQENARTTA